MAGLSVQFGAQVTGYPTRRTSPGYVGNYIYEPSTGGWYNHHRRQRPAKTPRHHQNKNNKNIAPPESPREDEPVHGQSSESGYDTNGDPQTPRKTKGSVAAPSNKSTRSDGSPARIRDGGRQSDGSRQSDDAQQNSSITSKKDTASGSVENTALNKLLRDLNRCDVSIQRYRTSLQQNCSEGGTQIKQIFSKLYQHLQTREHDLLQELVTIEQTAGSILERRKATLECLRAAAANCSELGEGGMEEIRTQIKQFVTDRKVDEEIGNIQRYEGDMDDILPHIMGFGKINNVRHLYTEWEEFPAELIIRNKSKVTFLSASDSEKMSAQSHEKNDIVSEATTSCSCSPGMQRMSTSRVDKKAGKRGEGKTVTSSKNTRESLSLPLSTTSPACSHPPSHFSRFGKNHHKESEEKTGKDVHREKYSPEELKVIQDRVKSSLENQGVFLYDPVTGAGPPPRTVKLPGSGRASVESETRKSEGEDTERDRRMREMTGEDQTGRKKKTPTQLRRERKKRQKEREKRQRELEKTGSEESDAQVTTPPPPLESAQVTTPPPPLESAQVTTPPPPLESAQVTTPPPPLESAQVTTPPPPLESGQVTTPPPPLESGQVTTPPPPLESAQVTTPPPPLESAQVTTPPPLESAQVTTPPPPLESTQVTTSPPPLESTQVTTSPPPLESTQVTTPPPPLESAQVTTHPPPLESAQVTTPPPPLESAQVTTPPPPLESAQVTTHPPPLESSQVTTPPPPLESTQVTTHPPPLESSQVTTPPPLLESAQVTTPPPPLESAQVTTPPPPLESAQVTTPPPLLESAQVATPPPQLESTQVTTPPPPLESAQVATPPPQLESTQVTTPPPPLESAQVTTPPPPLESTQVTTPPPPLESAQVTAPPPPLESSQVTTPPPPLESAQEGRSSPLLSCSMNHSTSVPPLASLAAKVALEFKQSEPDSHFGSNFSIPENQSIKTNS